jgi:hypothetical protein
MKRTEGKLVCEGTTSFIHVTKYQSNYNSQVVEEIYDRMPPLQ